MKTITLTPSQSERFWSKVDKSGECWTWTKGLTAEGYGNFFLDGKRPYSHRLSYEMHAGPIPIGMQVDHMCHNRACVNPDHLRLANSKQNQENKSGLSPLNTSGHRGVSWRAECRKWRAQVRHNGRTILVGMFDDVDDAGRAATQARNDLYTHNLLDRIPA